MNSLRHFLRELASLSPDLKLLALSIFFWGAGESLFFFVAPLYMVELGATPARIGDLFGWGPAAMALATIPAGILADRFGSKAVMWAGWLISLTGLAGMALAPSLGLFSVGWVSYWVGGLVLPAVSSYVTAGRGALPPERALTMTYSGWAIGNILSPALGGWIAEAWGMRSLFFIAGVAVLASIVTLSFVRRQPAARAEGGSSVAALLVNRRVLSFCALVLAAWFAMYLGLPLSANFLADVRGLSVSQVSTLGSFQALGLVAFNLVLGRLPPRRGFVLAQGMFVGYLALLLGSEGYVWIALAYSARSAAFVARTLAEAQATRVADRSQWGQAFGMLGTMATCGSMLAPLLAGRLYEARPALPFQLSLALLPITMLLVYFFAPRPALAVVSPPLLMVEHPPEKKTTPVASAE